MDCLTAYYPDGFAVTTDAAGAIGHLAAGAVVTGPRIPAPALVAAATDALLVLPEAEEVYA